MTHVQLDEKTPQLVISIGCDLIAASKLEAEIHAASAETGAPFTLKRVRSLEQLPELLSRARLVVIDLAKAKSSAAPSAPIRYTQNAGMTAPGAPSNLFYESLRLIQEFRDPKSEASPGKSWTSRCVVLGFGPHVERELLDEASMAGCDEVTTRSKLPQVFARLLRAAAPGVSSSAPRESSSESAEAGLNTSLSTVELSTVKLGAVERDPDRGVSALTAIVFGLIVSAVAYVGYSILPFYYDYYELQNHFEQMIPVAATETDMEIRRRLLYYIHRYELPVDDDQLQIARSGRTISISLRYREIFFIEWQGKEYFRWDFPFYAAAEGEF